MASKTTASDEAPKSSKRDPKMMAIGGVLVAAAIYWFGVRTPPVDQAAVVPAGEVEIVEGEILELPEMVLNLHDPDVTYLRIAVALVLEDGVAAADFEAESAIAKDILVQELSQLSASDLEDPTRRVEVKNQLSELVRDAYGDTKVSRVLFTALVMQ